MGQRLITRAEAKAKGLRRYYTGKPCVNGHIAERQTCDGDCMECKRERQREWVRDWRSDNPLAAAVKDGKQRIRETRARIEDESL